MRNPDNLFDLFYREFNQNNNRLGKGIDIYKVDNQYHLLLDLPGFKKEDIKIDYKEDVLSIEANRTTTESDQREYFCKNRSNRSVNRRIRFSDIDQDQIKAQYTDGVLSIELPIKVQQVIPARQIEIK